MGLLLSPVLLAAIFPVAVIVGKWRGRKGRYDMSEFMKRADTEVLRCLVP
jgi:hypothetical protein